MWHELHGVGPGLADLFVLRTAEVKHALRGAERVSPFETTEDERAAECARGVAHGCIHDERLDLRDAARTERHDGVHRAQQPPLEERTAAERIAEQRRALHADHRDLFEELSRLARHESIFAPRGWDLRDETRALFERL